MFGSVLLPLVSDGAFADQTFPSNILLVRLGGFVLVSIKENPHWVRKGSQYQKLVNNESLNV